MTHITTRRTFLRQTGGALVAVTAGLATLPVAGAAMLAADMAVSSELQTMLEAHETCRAELEAIVSVIRVVEQQALIARDREAEARLADLEPGLSQVGDRLVSLEYDILDYTPANLAEARMKVNVIADHFITEPGRHTASALMADILDLAAGGGHA